MCCNLDVAGLRLFEFTNRKTKEVFQSSNAPLSRSLKAFLFGLAFTRLSLVLIIDCFFLRRDRKFLKPKLKVRSKKN